MSDTASGYRLVSFTMGDMVFEYDENKNAVNIKKHGISFKVAARVFFDYNRIELYDEENSEGEDRYNTIGSTAVGLGNSIIGNIGLKEDILFVVYTERTIKHENGQTIDVTRIISARMATSFERGLYYGKQY